MRVEVCIALVALGTVLHGTARGEPGSEAALQLRWQAPAGCPDAAAMRAEIAEAAGAEAPRGTATARAWVATDGQWTVAVDVGEGPRLLRGDRCAEVARAAALVIGIALRNAAEPPRPARTAAQIGDREVPWRDPEIDRAAVEARVVRPGPAPRWRPALTAGAGAVIGALPDVAAMARGGVTLRRGAVAGRLEGTFATARRGLVLADETEAAVRVDLVAADGSGCWATTWVWVCGGIEVGTMRGSASAADSGVSGSGLWLAGHAGPSTAIPISPAIDLVLEAEASLPLAYPAFRVNGTPVGGPEPVAVRTSLGVRVEIP